MKKSLILLIVVICSFNLKAQLPAFQWVAMFTSGGGTIYHTSVYTDALDNTYITGFFQGTVNFDHSSVFPLGYILTATGGGMNNDAFVAKLNPSGDLVWVTQINQSTVDQGNEIMVDATGNIYVTGVYQISPSTSSPYQIFITKLNSSGSILWNKPFGSSPASSAKSGGLGYSIDVDPTGNVVTMGILIDTLDFDPGPGTYTIGGPSQNGYLSKLDANGNFVWAYARISNNNMFDGRELKHDNSSNIYYAGSFGGTGDFDYGPGTFTMSTGSSTISNAFVSQLNPTGGLNWAFQVGSPGKASAVTMDLDNSNNIYYGGAFTGTVDFNPGLGSYTLASPSSTTSSAFISKLSPTGGFIWAEQIDAVNIYAISADVLGNTYIVGYFTGTKDFDPGPATYTLSSFGGYDGFVLMLDPSGNFTWAGQIGGPNYETVLDVFMNTLGNVVMLGECNTSTDFDPGSGIANTFGNLQTHVFKFGSASVGLNELNNNLFSIYPNPSNGQLNVLFNKVHENAKVKVMNSLGQVVLEKNVSFIDKLSLSINEQPTGVYFVEVVMDGESYRRMIIKE